MVGVNAQVRSKYVVIQALQLQLPLAGGYLSLEKNEAKAQSSWPPAGRNLNLNPSTPWHHISLQ